MSCSINLYIAFASAKELGFQLGISGDLDFGVPSDRDRVGSELDLVERMLNRLTAYLRGYPARKRKESTP